MPYPIFDRNRLILKPLSERVNDLQRDVFLCLTDPIPEFQDDNLEILAERIIKAKERGATVLLMMGAHVIRSGVNRFLIDLMKKGYITLIGTNGASAIHDMEFAMIGESTESVARYIREGQFGLWKETGRVNDAARYAQENGYGLGEAVGKMIYENPIEFPYANPVCLPQDTNMGYQLPFMSVLGRILCTNIRILMVPQLERAVIGTSSR